MARIKREISFPEKLKSYDDLLNISKEFNIKNQYKNNSVLYLKAE